MPLTAERRDPPQEMVGILTTAADLPPDNAVRFLVGARLGYGAVDDNEPLKAALRQQLGGRYSELMDALHAAQEELDRKKRAEIQATGPADHKPGLRVVPGPEKKSGEIEPRVLKDIVAVATAYNASNNARDFAATWIPRLREAGVQVDAVLTFIQRPPVQDQLRRAGVELTPSLLADAKGLIGR